jgi:outer membrane biosynthesis protein TonB
MKKIVVIFVILSLIVFYLFGCSAAFGRRAPEEKSALRTLAGGVLGVLVAGNTGGAIVGALAADIFSLASIKYEDKQLENGEEAARRLQDKYKAEEEKKEDKKAEQKKPEDKKAEEIKEIDKKAEQKRQEDKKAEEIKETEKKAEKKKEDEKVKLIIEAASVLNQRVETGSTVESNVQYALLAPVDTQQIKITETRILSSAGRRMELSRREIIRTPGTYVSTIKFTMPEDMPAGYCFLYTTISGGKYTKSTKSVLNIM